MRSRHDDQPCTGEILRLKFALHQSQAPVHGALHQVRRNLGRHHGDLRTSALEQGDFSRCDFARAHDQHTHAGQVEEHRKIIHRSKEPV